MKIIITIVITTVCILFGFQNSDHVQLYFFVGKPVQIRLIFVIALAGICGYLIRYMIGIQREEDSRKKYRLLRLEEKKRKYHTTNEDNDDEY